MYEKSGCFDPNNSVVEAAADGFPQAVDQNLNLSAQQLPYDHHQQEAAAVSTMDIDMDMDMDLDLELQNHLAFSNLFMQQLVDHPDQLLSFDQLQDDPQQKQDLLSSFHLLPNPSIDSTGLSFIADLPASDSASVLYHLNLPPQPPLLGELFQSAPRGYGLPSSRDSSGGTVYEDEGGMLEFSGEASKKTKLTERERRVNLNDRFKALANLVPNPTKVHLSPSLQLFSSQVL